ncbi:PAS domain-containing protein [Bacteroides xylanisolvens]|uniref:histidine kinase n=1 Tax=Bacteroides xylanisolvens TaxID=371601 RepID=A0A415HZK1_9BACE|nr:MULTISPECIES: PAS domain-containing protein [Bacteroides]CAG9874004.1 Two-component system sensor histidine kinase [Bacteroides ovatus]MBS5057378.1 PAS domain-containing protein [Bacteroides sp.]MCA4467968.1 PAS domain-containing protein [Bacteroides xylanisolvens]MCA4472295.1 PAS domain-containing protein [Bacteroides xylanisolvens]MCA4481446.1 PAS domain-containing protein [Bacteroides xylanisolvens]
MNTEQNQKALLEQLEALKKENEQLKKELSILRNENISNRPVSFKEKYAVRILDSLPDMLTVFNQNEVGIEVVSNEETNHVGISNKDFKGMYMREMVPPEAYQNIHSNMRQAVSTGAVSTAHHELDFNGEHHHYENRIFPLDEEYVLIMCRDITERVTTQRQLEVFKSVLDKVSDSILAVSEDGTLVYANKQFIEEYGVTQQMGTQKIYDLPVSMTTKEAWERRLQEIRDNDGTFAYRAAYMRKGEDKERMHQVSTFLIRENNEELTWFFTQDITDVIKKQDELRELNLLLDGILNNIPVYLFVKDPENDFRYLYWNKAFADHSGIPASKAIGHTDYEVFPSHGDAEKFRKDDLELLQTHKRIDMQETYLSATGKARIVQTLKALVPMEGRKPLLIGISWDITNLQNIEQELIKARIKAEQSDRLKSAFLANMSHEIRTPLNAIVGFSQLLPAAETAEEKKLYSGIINQNSDILLQLINDILDLSKIEAGTLEYIKRPMNLGEVCRTIYAVHKERVKEGVTLVFDNVDENLFIEGDQNRIMQVITNFLTNASKFTYAGEIRLGFERTDKNIRVYVKDTGIGIEPEKVDHVFERFVKLNSFAQGTGLGLSICQMIIEKIGGEIGVTSELGKGSTFYFTIPYEEAGELGEIFKMSKTESKGNTVNRVQQIKKILVAEDVESNFILLKNLIGREYTLLWAKDGVEAIEMYKQYQPDLILMDIKMPRMDGLEATHIIRSYSKEVPIIALTAYAFETDKELALEMGCNDFVTKPVSKEALEKALEKFSV